MTAGTGKSGITWDSPLAAVAGGRAGKLESLGLRTVGDLLRHYPRRYVRSGELSGGVRLTEGDYLTVVGEVVSVEATSYADRRRGGLAWRTEVVVATADARLTLTFFDKRERMATWRAGKYRAGRVGLFSGQVRLFRNTWQLTHPDEEFLDAGAADAEGEHPPGLEVRPGDGRPDGAVDDEGDEPTSPFAPGALTPIYPANAGATSWQVRRTVAVALDVLADWPDPLPDDVRARHRMLGLREALTAVHAPRGEADVEEAYRRLRFEEAFVTQAALAARRHAQAGRTATPRPPTSGGLADAFEARLPFTLTAGQRAVGGEVSADLGRTRPMLRLLQGEVGSGKTLVALRAMLQVVDGGGQAALLAPTEVLAQQHRRTITGMLGDLAQAGLLGGADDATTVTLLTGSASAAERRRALAEIASGEAGIVIGTHALLEPTVSFHDLGLVVVDEQHRFGVEQRAALTDRAEPVPHVLVMTATPIPRSVAMTVFGDLETSVLAELPQGRSPVQTTVVSLARNRGWLERAWERVGEEVAAGRQAYVVCPAIAPGEQGGDAPSPGGAPPGAEVAAVEVVAPMLAAGPLAHLRLAPLHGRMSAEDKERTMTAFAAGEVDVLVATTVIEVGVDVPNATTMVVLDSDRFGISQLHQLRGRVGRGGHAGLCLLVTRLPDRGTDDEPLTPTAERLLAVQASNDGFELARVDLEQRREGDVLGAAQSGGRSGLRLLNVLEHEEVIVLAREDAVRLVDADPTLAGHPALARAVAALDVDERADFLERG